MVLLFLFLALDFFLFELKAQFSFIDSGFDVDAIKNLVFKSMNGFCLLLFVVFIDCSLLAQFQLDLLVNKFELRAICAPEFLNLLKQNYFFG